MIGEKMYSELISYLAEFMTEDRLALFDRMLAQRTRYLTVVLEDIFQSQNASAVLRSVDCFGLQDVFVVENYNHLVIDREVALGSSKWLYMKTFYGENNNSLEAIKYLRKRGYRIVATTPHEDDVSLEEFDLGRGKAALFFGTELTGVSDTVKQEADEFLKIPMYGFTESLNISVSAAVIIHYLTMKLRNGNIDWHLNPGEQQEVKLEWMRRSIKNSAFIEKQFAIKQEERK